MTAGNSASLDEKLIGFSVIDAQLDAWNQSPPSGTETMATEVPFSPCRAVKMKTVSLVAPVVKRWTALQAVSWTAGFPVCVPIPSVAGSQTSSQSPKRLTSAEAFPVELNGTSRQKAARATTRRRFTVSRVCSRCKPSLRLKRCTYLRAAKHSYVMVYRKVLIIPQPWRQVA